MCRRGDLCCGGLFLCMDRELGWDREGHLCWLPTAQHFLAKIRQFPLEGLISFPGDSSRLWRWAH